MSFASWPPYVPVAKRREQAAKAAAKAQKGGKNMHPVVITGRTITTTFWGKAWCDNLEAYSDYANRLPRGRAYTRNGSVIDLVIEAGTVRAKVMGSSLYSIEISIVALPNLQWKSLAQACTGSIASLVELLQGKLSKAVMEHICQPKTGLFPAPKDIKLKCSCPDWADMCKHVAAALYGVGARLDAQPQLLFTLRQVDPRELVTQAAQTSISQKTPSKSKVLDTTQLADVFGLEMDTPFITPKTSAKSTLNTLAKAPPKKSEKSLTSAPTKAKPPVKTKSPPPKNKPSSQASTAIKTAPSKTADAKPTIKKPTFKTPIPKRTIEPKPAQKNKATQNPALKKASVSAKKTAPKQKPVGTQKLVTTSTGPSKSTVIRTKASIKNPSPKSLTSTRKPSG